MLIIWKRKSRVIVEIDLRFQRAVFLPDSGPGIPKQKPKVMRRTEIQRRAEIGSVQTVLRKRLWRGSPPPPPKFFPPPHSPFFFFPPPHIHFNHPPRPNPSLPPFPPPPPTHTR